MTKPTSQELLNMPTITGNDLIRWGYKPGPRFKDLIAQAQAMVDAGNPIESISAMLLEVEPLPVEIVPLELQDPNTIPIDWHLHPELGNQDEEKNSLGVLQTIREVMKTPTVRHAMIMPDACPAGSVGTIPVGGVIAAENAIHPGMHSSDICCSVMNTFLGKIDPKLVLDIAQSVTHFGPGGRQWNDLQPLPEGMEEEFMGNKFLFDGRMLYLMRTHMGTQGDGNHFLSVGKLRSTQNTCLTTHHGSRGPGALLYKLGMEVAEKHRRKYAPTTLKQNAWIPADSEEGQEYWKALQIIRKWTKANHETIHRRVAQAVGINYDDLWPLFNEHNFVFHQKETNLYWHAKGATPDFFGFADRSTSVTFIPLNMAAPILVCATNMDRDNFRFAPHGAGRNYSRTEHARRAELTVEEAFALETKNIDARFFSGKVDAGELPSAYKSADKIIAEIEEHQLTDIVDYIDPYGCIMAGEQDKFWLKKKEAAE